MAAVLLPAPAPGVAGLPVAEVARADRLEGMRSGKLGSVHSWELVTAVDGPGTRLTVFLSGCPLRCLYCHNPDTLALRDGHLVEVDDVVDRMRRYQRVFAATGGGVTLSGGEVLMQPAFAGRILHAAAGLGIHTALDTSGYLGRNADDGMLADVDLVLLDVKSGDPATYRRVTGRELAPTLRFGERVAASGTTLWIRFVLVPGLTDDPENVAEVARYAGSLERIRPGAVERVEVLPFHQLGRAKWEASGRRYELAGTRVPTPDEVERARDAFRAVGLRVF